ncbi:MAG: hypothetical protein ACYCW6_11565 [Candidatus Xenobia bacterium]
MRRALLFFLLLTLTALADPRHITVTGKAELRVPPDGAPSVSHAPDVTAGSIVPGSISVSAEVRITFELKASASARP